VHVRTASRHDNPCSHEGSFPSAAYSREREGWHRPCVGLIARRLEFICVVVKAAVDFITTTLRVTHHSCHEETIMTPQQITLIQNSWTEVVPISETAAGLFYQRLFALDPSVRPMFKGDMREQGLKLMKMLGMIVNGLTRLDELVPAAQDLARRHVGYGVQPAHYDTVGAALLWTLEQGLGSKFSDDLKSAWAAAYGTLANVMKEAAYAPA
jgi:hemoglobin-like flavoprotein